MSTPAPVLEVSDLRVQYGKRVAVDGLDLRVNGGEIVGMLGPNGAGKSTSLLAMAGAVTPSSGRVRIAGVDLGDDPMTAQAQVGFADQPPSLYEFFTVAEHLAFVAESRGHDGKGAQRELLDQLGLGGIADRLCRELSFGMRQRVGLAAALIGEVRVVLLDETLNGLDPRAAKSAREAVARAAEGGAAVLMSTHLLGVAERLCQRIVIMDQGTLAADVAGAELDALVDKGPGALEELYLSLVTSDELT
ncbi:ABC transporter ATP-binding protein [Haliangium sp.]|uniref:ABC transporter ATP-binding protein n=1 Tax=Haliangium sp. TaxID=2663208 RepID=UPI003D136EF7